MTLPPEDTIWDELPDDTGLIVADGEVVGITWGEDTNLDETNEVLVKACLPPVTE